MPQADRMSAGLSFGPGRFSELFTGLIEQQRVVAIDRCWQSKMVLQQTMQVGRGHKVGAACHMGDALHGVVNNHTHMVAGAYVFAGQQHIAPSLRGRALKGAVPRGPGADFLKAQFGDAGHGQFHIETQRRRPRPFIDLRQRTTGVMWCAVGVAGAGPLTALPGGHGADDLLAAGPRRIKQPAILQSIQGRAVISKML